MKKISLLPIIALFLSTSCLILAPQTESSPQANFTAAPTASAPPAKKTTVPFTPQRRATSTPNPTATIELTPRWTLSPPAPADRSIYKDDLAPEYQPVLEALPYASLYSITFIIADDLYHITGNETVTYTNAEDVELKEVGLRLFPNILDGEMIVENVTVNNESVKMIYSLDNSLLTLRLKNELQPQESVTISMDFNITVAQTLGAHYSVQTYYDNVLTLAHAYPMIAVYDDEGWNAEVPSPYGDLTYADASFYIVTVDAPAQLILVGSGREINREESANRQRVIYAAGPARDFYLAASSDYSVVTQEINGIMLRFYARKSEQTGAKYALNAAARAIEMFSEKYAPYPYRELDFVSTATTAGGIEYPGAIAISKTYIVPNNIYLEAIAVHETGHQWFYNLIGNDQLDDPWLDESLTQFITLQYFTDTDGQISGIHQELENRWAIIDNKEIPIGLPVRDYSKDEYSAIIYGRGALFFEALRDEMGTYNFDVFLRDYAQSNAWDIATLEEFKQKAEEHCACDLTPLFQKWIYP